MGKHAVELSIEESRRAGCAVYAVGIGQQLGLNGDELIRLRAAVSASALTGDDRLDEVLLFVQALLNEGELGVWPAKPRGAGSERLNNAYLTVAPVIQPFDW